MKAMNQDMENVQPSFDGKQFARDWLKANPDCTEQEEQNMELIKGIKERRSTENSQTRQ